MNPTDTPQATTSEASPPTPDHNSRGKFAPGNKAGRGNPHAVQLARNRKEFIAALEKLAEKSDEKTAVRVAAKQLMQAVNKGQPWAIKEMLDRLMGKPTIHVDPLTLDIESSQAAMLQIFYKSADGVRHTLGGETPPAPPLASEPRE